MEAESPGRGVKTSRPPGRPSRDAASPNASTASVIPASKHEWRLLRRDILWLVVRHRKTLRRRSDTWPRKRRLDRHSHRLRSGARLAL